MKVIQHCYSTETKWIDVVAKAMGGIVEGNFVKGDNEIYTGTHFFLELEEKIAAMLVDTSYKEDVLLKYKNDETSFIGLYFYITNNNVDFILDNEALVVGKYDYNLTIIDSDLETDYAVNKGTHTYAICIFISKRLLQEFMETVPRLKLVSKDVFNEEKNTIVSMGRMGTESLNLINDFRKISYDNPLFELYFRGLSYNLMGHFIALLLTKKIIISKVIEDDIKSILASKIYLMENIDEVFPGIDFLANQALMSSSKYKTLFTKISGLTPAAFFYSNKLQRAKDLLETGTLTVSEISDKLNYANISHLAKRFNNKYGIFPKEYQSFL